MKTLSNEQLRQAFLSPGMKYYFDKKLAPLPGAEVDARIEELLKYLKLAIHSDGDIPFSREIDEVWQYWVLETAEYMALCRKLPGGGFVHYTSIDYVEYADEGVRNQRIGLARGLAILSAYVLNYGPFQADRLQYWPAARQLMKGLGWGLDAFNQWLVSMHRQTAQPKPREAVRSGVVLELVA